MERRAVYHVLRGPRRVAAQSETLFTRDTRMVSRWNRLFSPLLRGRGRRGATDPATFKCYRILKN